MKLVFDMIDRSVWDPNKISTGSVVLINANVRNVYIIQTNGIECDNYMDCVAIVRQMQVLFI